MLIYPAVEHLDMFPSEVDPAFDCMLTGRMMVRVCFVVAVVVVVFRLFLSCHVSFTLFVVCLVLFCLFVCLFSRAHIASHLIFIVLGCFVFCFVLFFVFADSIPSSILHEVGRVYLSTQ